MHIKEFELTNIRGIETLKVRFSRTAGWHVFIGDNGSGKSTILRALALAILGEDDGNRLQVDWSSFIRKGTSGGKISMKITNRKAGRPKSDFVLMENEWNLTINTVTQPDIDRDYAIIDNRPIIYDFTEGSDRSLSRKSFFSTSFGAFRKLTHAKSDHSSFKEPKGLVSAHRSLFDDNANLKHNIAFLQDLDYQELEARDNGPTLLPHIIGFINQTALLPKGIYFDRVTSSDVFVRQNDQLFSILEMSDGIRTTLGLVLEIIRQQVLQLGKSTVANAFTDNASVNQLPGIIMIDEAALHLHPSWQTRVGEWFVSAFPNVQFIVTTHSPLVCRAASNGSIWQLTGTNNNVADHEVTGRMRDRLIYGNVLDAYGTELFGEQITISEESTDYKERLAELHQKMIDGEISNEEREEMFEIRAKMPTENVEV